MVALPVADRVPAPGARAARRARRTGPARRSRAAGRRAARLPARNARSRSSWRCATRRSAVDRDDDALAEQRANELLDLVGLPGKRADGVRRRRREASRARPSPASRASVPVRCSRRATPSPASQPCREPVPEPDRSSRRRRSAAAAACASGAIGRGRRRRREALAQVRGDRLGLRTSAYATSASTVARARPRASPGPPGRARGERPPQLDVVDRERGERLDQRVPRDDVHPDGEMRAHVAERLGRVDEPAGQVERVAGPEHDVEDRLRLGDRPLDLRAALGPGLRPEGRLEARARARSSASRPRPGARRRRGCRSARRIRATRAASRTR